MHTLSCGFPAGYNLGSHGRFGQKGVLEKREKMRMSYYYFHMEKLLKIHLVCNGIVNITNSIENDNFISYYETDTFYI